MPRKRKTPLEPSTDATAPANTDTAAHTTSGPSQGAPQPPGAVTEPSIGALNSRAPTQTATPTSSTTTKALSPPRNPPPTDPEAKEGEEPEKKDKRPLPSPLPLPSTTYRLVWYHNLTSPTPPSRCSPTSTLTITQAQPAPTPRASYTATLTNAPLQLSFSVNYGLKQIYTHPSDRTNYTLTPTSHTVLQNHGCISVSPPSLLRALARRPAKEQVWATGGVMGADGTVAPVQRKGGETMRVPLTVAMSLERDDKGEQFVEFWGWVDGGGWEGGLVWAVGRKVRDGEGGGGGELSLGERGRLGISGEDWGRSGSV